MKQGGCEDEIVTEFTIPDDLAELLDNIAQRENRSVDELVEEALQQYASEHLFSSEEQRHKNPFLIIAEAADQLGLGSSERDIAERSREILNYDFPEHLMRRMHGDYSDSEK